MRSVKMLACHQTGWRQVYLSGCCLTPLHNLNWVKHPGPIHFMPQLGTGLRAARSCEKIQCRDTEADLVPGVWPRWWRGSHCWCLFTKHYRKSPDFWKQWNWFNSHNHNTVIPSHSLVSAPFLPTICHNLALDLGWQQQGKRWELGLHLNRATDTYTGSSLDLCKYTSPTYFSTPILWEEIKQTLSRTEPTWAKLSGLLLQQLESRPDPGQDNWHWAERKSPFIPCACSSCSNTSHVPYQVVNTLWGNTWLVSTSNLALTPKTLDIHSLHRDVPT